MPKPLCRDDSRYDGATPWYGTYVSRALKHLPPAILGAPSYVCDSLLAAKGITLDEFGAGRVDPTVHPWRPPEVRYPPGLPVSPADGPTRIKNGRVSV